MTELRHAFERHLSFDLILFAGKGSILFYEFPFFEVFVCRLNHIKNVKFVDFYSISNSCFSINCRF